MNIQAVTREQKLLLEVFKLIVGPHFLDHKMVPDYVAPMRFPRALGDDIGRWVEMEYPEQYQQLRVKLEEIERKRQQALKDKPIEWHEKPNGHEG